MHTKVNSSKLCSRQLNNYLKIILNNKKIEDLQIDQDFKLPSRRKRKRKKNKIASVCNK